jgi:hypothetical protein
MKLKQHLFINHPDTNQGMTYKVLFLVGLAFFLVGQLLIAKGNAFIYQQKPIDFAHWFLLVGAVFLIPQTVTFARSFYSLIGIPLTLIGIVSIIGMCVLDFIWWSFPTEEMRLEFSNHISQIPSIWNPFIKIGPSSKVFNLGLLLLSLNYWVKDKAGIIILIAANLILWHVIPLPFRIISGYALTLIAFSLMLLGQKHQLHFNRKKQQ